MASLRHAVVVAVGACDWTLAKAEGIFLAESPVGARPREVILRRYVSLLLLPVPLLALACGRAPFDVPPEPGEFGRVLIGEEEYTFTDVSCVVSGTCGGPVVWSLRVEFVDSTKDKGNRLTFSVQDRANDPCNLVSSGPHPATGQHWDKLGNYLQEHTYSIGGIKQDEMEIVWTDITGQGHDLCGEGYVHIKKTIEFALGDSIWVDGRWVGEGDPEYEEIVARFDTLDCWYPPQVIWFSCGEGGAHP